MIEQYKPYIEGLLRTEPWRAGPGDIESPCSGALSFDGTRWWLCTSCGRIGPTSFLHHFKVKQSPYEVFLKRLVSRFFEPLLPAT